MMKEIPREKIKKANKNDALRVSPAVTRLTVYRRLQVPAPGEPGSLGTFRVGVKLVGRRAKHEELVENFCNFDFP